MDEDNIQREKTLQETSQTTSSDISRQQAMTWLKSLLGDEAGFGDTAGYINGQSSSGAGASSHLPQRSQSLALLQPTVHLIDLLHNTPDTSVSSVALADEFRLLGLLFSDYTFAAFKRRIPRAKANTPSSSLSLMEALTQFGKYAPEGEYPRAYGFLRWVHAFTSSRSATSSEISESMPVPVDLLNAIDPFEVTWRWMRLCAGYSEVYRRGVYRGGEEGERKGFVSLTARMGVDALLGLSFNEAHTVVTGEEAMAEAVEVKEVEQGRRRLLWLVFLLLHRQMGRSGQRERSGQGGRNSQRRRRAATIGKLRRVWRSGGGGDDAASPWPLRYVLARDLVMWLLSTQTTGELAVSEVVLQEMSRWPSPSLLQAAYVTYPRRHRLDRRGDSIARYLIAIARNETERNKQSGRERATSAHFRPLARGNGAEVSMAIPVPVLRITAWHLPSMQAFRCPYCRGFGFIVKRPKNGKATGSKTAGEVKEPCPRCFGQGTGRSWEGKGSILRRTMEYLQREFGLVFPLVRALPSPALYAAMNLAQFRQAKLSASSPSASPLPPSTSLPSLSLPIFLLLEEMDEEAANPTEADEVTEGVIAGGGEENAERGVVRLGQEKNEDRTKGEEDTGRERREDAATPNAAPSWPQATSPQAVPKTISLPVISSHLLQRQLALGDAAWRGRTGSVNYSERNRALDILARLPLLAIAPQPSPQSIRRDYLLRTLLCRRMKAGQRGEALTFFIASAPPRTSLALQSGATYSIAESVEAWDGIGALYAALRDECSKTK